MTTSELLTIVQIVVGIVGGIIIVNIWAYKKDKLDTYAYLDKVWMELLALYREAPHFSQESLVNNYMQSFEDDEMARYHCFAMTLHTTMETIFDVYEGSIPDAWRHIVSYQSKLHRTWLLQNSTGFRPGYLELVKTF